MRVIKVLNTSVVLALDDQDTEVVLMGKGIGFRQPIGSVLDERIIEKVFVLKDRAISRSIIRLAAEQDAVVFEIAKEAIDYAAEKFSMNFTEHIYLSLTDHLAFAIQRAKEDLVLPGFYSVELRRYNPQEFAAAMHTVKLIRQRLGIELPEGELSSIAFHFINAQRTHPRNLNNLKIEDLVKNILGIVKYTFGISYEQETISYSRFLTHLQAFAQRLVLQQQLPEEENFLYDEITRNYPAEHNCVKRIAAFVRKQYGAVLTNQEVLYLIIHVHRVLQENPSLNKGGSEE